MIETVEKFLIEYDLIKPEAVFLVGFSGGCDSLCLIDILHGLSQKHKFKIIALHLNHNWRGEESLREAENCKKYCDARNIEFILETLDENGNKTEKNAREARYAFFLKQAKNHPGSLIFTAHTRSDNAETIIYRIIKGTGTKGIRGILPKRIREGIELYRPLLSISRSQTEDYCNSKGLVANTDSSNFDINYKRNFIRHKIMPLFKEINFQAEKSIASLAQLAISQSNIIDEYIKLILKDLYVDGKILSEKFKLLSQDVMQQIIYEACLKYDLDYDRKKISHILDFIKSNVNSKAGSTYSLTNDLWIFTNSKYIYLINKTKADINKTEIHIKQEGEYKIDGTPWIFSIQKYTEEKVCKFPEEDAPCACVDLENLGLDLTLRTRREGDFISPFGMKGTMKLKKYLNDKEVPQHKRDELILLTKGSEVLWVAQVGLSNKLKVVNKPSHMLELKEISRIYSKT